MVSMLSRKRTKNTCLNRQHNSLPSLFLGTFLFLLSSLLVVRGQDDGVPLYKNPSASVEDRVADLLPRMTLRDKVGQMIMDAENSLNEIVPEIGAYIIGAAFGAATVVEWRSTVNRLQAQSAHFGLGIPVLVGTDAVHGHNVLSGATVFPHNVGLGATRNTQLLFEIAQVTAREVAASGVDQAFAPALSVARTISWGRTYESYSENTDLVSEYTKPFIYGLQERQSSQNSSIIATAKHWIADGGTQGGVDRGDALFSSVDEMLVIHGAPYLQAIQAGVGSIMISFSSVNGVQMHMLTDLITNVLKQQYGFQGITLSDWLAYELLPTTSFDEQMVMAINAGIDMLMCPFQGYAVLDSLTRQVNDGFIPVERIDDAVTRILRTKFAAGLFEKYTIVSGTPAISVEGYDSSLVGSVAHRAVARQAVRESLVLLYNGDVAATSVSAAASTTSTMTTAERVLPLSKSARIVMLGKSADNIRNQCGGWTMSWQGTDTESPTYDILGGNTIFQGFQKLTQSSVAVMTATIDDPSQYDVAVVVVGETPYAEAYGDNGELVFDQEDQTVIANALASGLPTVVVFITGRPLLLPQSLLSIIATTTTAQQSVIPPVAVVAAWLPGTEGDGIAEVLYGDYEFTGKLPFSWPASIDQVFDANLFIGDNPDVIFPFGYGLSYTSPGSSSSTGTEQTTPTDVQSTSAPTDTVDNTLAPSDENGDATSMQPTVSPSNASPSSSSVPIDIVPTKSPTAQPSLNAKPVAISKIVPNSTDAAISDKVETGRIPLPPGQSTLVESTSSSITISWEAPSYWNGNSQVTEKIPKYVVYESDFPIGTTNKTIYVVEDLKPWTKYNFSVVAVDKDGNQSPPSTPFFASTNILVDSFPDGDNIARGGWGVWNAAFGGANGDGFAELNLEATGSTGNGAELRYLVDNGEWGFSDLHLDLAVGQPVNLTFSEVVGISFKLRGKLGSILNVHLKSSAARDQWAYYEVELKPTSEWQTFSLLFDQFQPTSSVSYSLVDAIQNATSIAWESKEVGTSGWFVIDDVEFIITNSTSTGVELNGARPDFDGLAGYSSGASFYSFSNFCFLCLSPSLLVPLLGA